MTQIYALKVDEKHAATVRASLNEGIGRFGWSYVETADLHQLKARIDAGQRMALTGKEEDCWQPFLLDFRAGDHVVFINVPSWGRCTLAQVTAPYFFEWADDDFNHRFHVDPASVQEFDRNDSIVGRALSQRLKLQRRWWRIQAEEEFQALRAALAKGVTPAPYTAATNAAQLGKELDPLLLEMTRKIQRTHPNYDLEGLCRLVFERVPGVRKVTQQGGAGDHGADLLVEYDSGLPIIPLQERSTCVVQVKSFVGEHWDTKAVRDIERAFERYPNAAMGLIISTADASTPDLDNAIAKLRDSSGKAVELMVGADAARFLLRYGQDVLG